MGNKTWFYLSRILLIIVLVNILFLDYLWVKKEKGESSVLSTSTWQSPPTPSPTPLACPPACREEIHQLMAESIATISGEGKVIERIVEKVLPTATPQSVSQAKVLYIPLASSASSTETKWADTPFKFYFNQADYPGLKSVHFEAHLKALHGSGRVFARLYDESNKRGVDFSELSTQSATYKFLQSSSLIIWYGNNLYRVQLRSINGTEVLLEQARLRIVLE